MSSHDQIVDLLEWTVWGKEFDRKELDAIALYMSIRFFKKGEKIVEEGERSRYMAFIVKGEVQIIKKSCDNLESLIVSLRPGTHFGEMAFVDEQPRSASVYSLSESTLLFLSKNDFEMLIDIHPQTGIKMLKLIARLLSQRLRMTTGKLAYLRA